MQGYDSVAMGVDGEVGGNDQTFNMLVGRDLLKKISNKEKFVIGMKLLVDSSGKKMGKTENNMVSLGDSPADMFGKVMSWPDSFLPNGFELCTKIAPEEIAAVVAGNPRNAKLSLATAIVDSYFGNGTEMKEQFLATFSRGEVPEDTATVTLSAGSVLQDILLEQKLVSSKSEFRRLVEEGAVSFDNEKITDVSWQPSISGVLKVGKRRFLKLIV